MKAVPRVLVVEDDPVVGPELAGELESRGYDVEWVRDAQAGAPRPGGAAPDVVVLDYYLPRGDGLSLTRAWKSLSVPPAVVLVSGADVTAEIQRRLPADRRPDRVFAKPMAISTFTEAVLELVAPPAARGRKPSAGRVTPLASRPPALPDLLWRVSRERRSGVLELPGPDGTANVSILNGAPVFVDSGTPGESLGRVMLREGMLRAHEYPEVLERILAGLAEGRDGRVGEIAVELGYVTAEQVVDAMRIQVREKLVNLFHREELDATFHEGRDRVVVGATFRAEPGEVILEGIRRHYGARRLSPLYARYEHQYAALAPAFDELRRELRFAPREQRFVAQIRGDRTVRALVEGGQLERVHAMQVVCMLLVVDGLDLSNAPLAAARAAPATSPGRDRSGGGRGDPAREDVLRRQLRVNGRTHYDALGVASRATQSEIDDAYTVLAARYSPDRLVTLGLGDVHEQATELWARIAIAYETLRDPIRREAYDQTLPSGGAQGARASRQAAYGAELAFQAGLRELSADRPADAAREFGRARAFLPDEPEYVCLELWADCLDAVKWGAEARITAREARERMEQSIAGRRPRPRALHVLALACQLAGDLAAAAEHAAAALAFEPGFAEARRLHDALAAAAPAGDLVLG